MQADERKRAADTARPTSGIGNGAVEVDAALPSVNLQLEKLLEHIQRDRGFDFTGYKRASLERRINKRLQYLGLGDFDAYSNYLDTHPPEFTKLFNTVLINVTGFFRDPGAWQYLASYVLPRIINSKGPGEQIRVWCAGAASGEEAYTISMLLADALGDDAFRTRVKVYATDVDEEALASARLGTYSEQNVAGIPSAFLAKYIEYIPPGYVFRKDLRHSVVFGRHDLLQDAPISRIDLLICRNTLMYFNSETQTRLLTRFHFALSDTGYLFLGRAEMLFTHISLYVPVELKWRVFSKVTPVDSRYRLPQPEPDAGAVGNGAGITQHLDLDKSILHTERAIRALQGRATPSEESSGARRRGNAS